MGTVNLYLASERSERDTIGVTNGNRRYIFIGERDTYRSK